MYQLTIESRKKEIFQTVFHDEYDALFFMKKQGIDTDDDEFLKCFFNEFCTINYLKTFGYLSQRSKNNVYSQITIRKTSVQSVSVDFKKNHQSLVAILQKLIEGKEGLMIVEKLGTIQLFLETEDKPFEVGMLGYNDKLRFQSYRSDTEYKKENDIFQTFMKMYKMKKRYFDRREKNEKTLTENL